MNQNHKELISIGLTVSIVILSLFIIHKFIPSIVWAGIIVIASHPLYRAWCVFFPKRSNLAAFLFTTLMALLFLLPLSWLITILVKESQLFASFLNHLNQYGGAAPEFFTKIPFVSADIVRYWDEHLGQPGHVKQGVTHLYETITPATYYIKQVGVNIAHRSVQVGFTLLTLFFFYRDGDALLLQINHVGEYCLGKRWFRYANRLPQALRATVNGTIIVGIGVGILMGISYQLVGFPAPTLMGFITALAAMIPFVAPVIFIAVALILLIIGKVLGAISVLVWGTLVLFVADHFIKPVMIGGAIKLPFLAVLFGILGGVETLGLLGLFVGPMIMVLFVTLWQETST